MKLRKLFATAAMALFVGASASAINPEEVRIYINPGHGSWTSGDRHMATVFDPEITRIDPDTTGFFESNTNLQKCYGLLEKLISFGVPFDRTKNQTNDNPHRIGAALDLSQNIVFSHVKPGAWPPYLADGSENPDNDYYNRYLSEISAEVEFNDFDLFISVHSNALTDGTSTNYPLFLYRGTNAQEGNPGSIAVSKACWPYIYGLGHHQWTAYKTSMCIWGDHDFYGGPGTATYEIPAGTDYVFDESTSFSEYIAPTETTPGYVKYTGYLGVIKHGVPGFLAEGYFHTYQPSRHRYMNWDVCHLEGVAYARGIADYYGWDKKETKGTIYGIVRDKHERFSHDYYKPNSNTNDAYKPLNGVVVTLKKDGAEVATYTTDEKYNGAFVFNVEPGTYTIECTHADYKPMEEVMEVTIAAGENVYPEPMLENVAYEPPAIVYVNYPDEIIENDIKAASSYNVNVESLNIAIAELEGTTIRRTLVRDDMLYILALKADNSPVLLAHHTVENSTKVLGTTVCNGTSLKLSDIALTADGVLIGCAKGKNHYDSSVASSDGEERGKVYLYKWEKDSAGVATGEATEWFYTQKTGNFYRAYVGNTMYYNGTMESGYVVLTAETVSSSGNIWNIKIDIVDGIATGDAFARPDMHYKTEYTDDYTWNLSPINEDYYVVSGSGKLPMEIILDDNITTHTNLAEGLFNVNPAKIKFFKYAGASIMAAADEVDGKAVVKLINVTSGFDKARLIEILTPEGTDLGALDNASVDARTVVERDADGNLTNYWLEIFLINGGKYTKLTTKSVEQPIVRGEYAYNLAMTEAEGVYTLSFDVTGADATDANVILTDENGNEQVIAVEGVKAGANSVEVDGATLADGQYTWAVEVNGKAIPTANRIHVDGTIISGNNRGGVAIDDDPESDNYGKVYVTGGYSMGIQVVDQQLNSEGRYLTNKFNSGNSSSPFRCATSEGKVYISDWSDNNSGIWVFDPAKTSEMKNVFDESTRQSGGEFKNSDGTVTGGGTTGVSFVGKGEDRKMFMFCEDYPSTNGQTPVGYDLGTADNWASAPTYIYSSLSGLLANTNVEVNAYEEGTFWSQIRGAGNNTVGVPGFLFVDFEGNVIFNSGESLKELTGCNGAGLALNKDKNLFAVANGNANVNIYEFAFVDGVPTFNFLYEVYIKDATEVNQIRFDAANNMYIYGRKVGLAVYSLPQEAPKAVTPAKASYVILGGELTGIEDVEFNENAPVEYYNLQGMKVANPEKGIFIKKQGKKATRVVL